MDKTESKLRIEEIEKLKKKKRYREAARLADTIEWHRIRNAVTLYKVADLYKICREYGKCRELLEYAHERNPYAKNVVFALCDVNLEFGQFDAATEYYREYASLAPDDTGILILKYKMLNALEAGIDERIEILEKLKSKSRSEEWQYELATLYHRAGLAEKCVEECNDIITWFGDGSFVYKAMELKMLHEPLTPEEEAVYTHRTEKKTEKAEAVRQEHSAHRKPEKHKKKQRPAGRPSNEEEEYHVKTINMGQFNTIDLQAELAENIQNYIGGEPSMIDRRHLQKDAGNDSAFNPALASTGNTTGDLSGTRTFVRSSKVSMREVFADADDNETEPSYAEEPVYNTGASSDYASYGDTGENIYPEDLLAGLEMDDAESGSGAGEDFYEDEFVRPVAEPVRQDAVAESNEVFFEDSTGDFRYQVNRPVKEAADDSRLREFKNRYSKEMEGKKLPEGFGRLSGEEEGRMETVPIVGGVGIVEEKVLEDGTVELIKHFEEDAEPEVVKVAKDRKTGRIQTVKTSQSGTGKMPQGAARVSSSTGRISTNTGKMNLPGRDYDPDYVDMLPTPEEKQISGQLNIQDILAGWEETKKQKEREFKESFRKRTLENTGNMFADFDKEANSGLLATLENPALINSVTDQSSSEDFFKGVSVEDIKKGKQVVYPERKEDGLRIGKVIETPPAGENPEEEAEPVQEETYTYKEDAAPSDEETNHLYEQEEPAAAKKSEEPAVDEEDEPEVIPDEEPAAASEPEEEDEPAAIIEEEIPSAASEPEDEEEKLIRDILEEDEKEKEDRRNQYYGSVTQKISGNIWEEVDNYVPQPAVTEEPEEEVPLQEVVPAEEEAPAQEAVPVRTENVFEAEEDEEPEVLFKDKAPVKEAKYTAPVSVPEATQESSEEAGDSASQAEEQASRETSENKEEGNDRDLTTEEKQYFGPYVYSKRMKRQIVDAVETMTLAAFTGNLIITADSSESSSKLAKAFYQYMKNSDPNFTGKSASIGAEKLNKKDMTEIFDKLSNGCLIVSHAGKMANSTINAILENLNQDVRGVEVILHDNKTEIRRLLERAQVLERFFNCRVDITAMSPEMLAEFGKKYAMEKGYSIDDMAMLAFSGRISELQIGTHLVSIDEVKEIVDEAINRADRPGPEKSIRTLTGKRFDKDHRVILREKDFEFRK